VINLIHASLLVNLIAALMGDGGEAISGITSSIDLVNNVIEEVNMISQSIVSSVEEQSATVNEISNNVSYVSTGAKEVARNVTESAQGLALISKTITGVSDSAESTALETSHINSSIKELSSLAENLKTLLGQFKI
jgi:methyl-accepting chemotaxis protein